MMHKQRGELLKFIEKKELSIDLDLVGKAFDVAVEAHKDQKRKSGEPYIIHPIEVAYILSDMGMDTETICAGLMHDVVEDTPITSDDIESQFGSEIATMVNGVTKLGQVPLATKEEQQAENIRKMLLAMAEDVRIIIIKLTDRLHNMRTLFHMTPEKQLEKSLETMEIYAPIAHRLGIRAVKEELEDLALRYLDPIACKEIDEYLSINYSSSNNFINSIQNKIKERLSEFEIEPHIYGRIKSNYSVYRKVYSDGKSFDEVFDIFAVRIIVSTVTECYNTLGIIHDMYRPIPNRFKDYISTPKANMYQSLHTTVISREGVPFEIQIRTWDMHNTAEYGIAAHWKYKVGVQSRDKLDESLSWIRQIIELQQEVENAEDVVRTIKTELVTEEVYVFTPKGDVKCLPVGSTVIDFAYSIHSAVGNKMVGAKINGRIVPLDTTIKTGQIIDVITTKSESHSPNRDWINIVKTSEAKNKIRSWYKKERKEENIEHGKLDFERELKHNLIHIAPEDMDTFLLKTSRKQHYETVNDFFAAIGYGGILLSNLMPRLKDEYEKKNGISEIHINTNTNSNSSSNYSGVLVDGVDNCPVKFAQCCHPLPGDNIIGFITKGHGVSIHKKDCSNVADSMKHDEHLPRWVNAIFQSPTQATRHGFKSTIDVVSTNGTTSLANISMELESSRVPIHEFSGKALKNKNFNIVAIIEVQDVTQLNHIVNRLKKIDGVVSVNRTTC